MTVRYKQMFYFMANTKINIAKHEIKIFARHFLSHIPAFSKMNKVEKKLTN